jgi:Sulfotransferase family
MDSRRPLFVASAPRTGTTWVAWVLSVAPGVTWINEPDNEWPNVFALKAKRTLGRFPVLEKGDIAPPEYQELWARAFQGFRQSALLDRIVYRADHGDKTMLQLWRALCDHANPEMSRELRLLTALAPPPGSKPKPLGGRRHSAGAPQRVLVKSVYAPLALEWITARFQPQTVIVLRHPLNMMASWVELMWGGCALDTNPTVREHFAARWDLPELDPDASSLQRIAWEVGLFLCALHAGIDEHPEWVVVSHDDLAVEPTSTFKRLYEDLGLGWTPKTEAFLEERNRPGEGFAVFRVASELPERWRKRLSKEQLDEVWSVWSQISAPWVDQVRRDLA